MCACACACACLCVRVRVRVMSGVCAFTVDGKGQTVGDKQPETRAGSATRQLGLGAASWTYHRMDSIDVMWMATVGSWSVQCIVTTTSAQVLHMWLV
jgi:hypothetical protein